jgi:hypothetical protein
MWIDYRRVVRSSVAAACRCARPAEDQQLAHLLAAAPACAGSLTVPQAAVVRLRYTAGENHHKPGNRGGLSGLRLRRRRKSRRGPAGASVLVVSSRTPAIWCSRWASKVRRRWSSAPTSSIQADQAITTPDAEGQAPDRIRSRWSGRRLDQLHGRSLGDPGRPAGARTGRPSACRRPQVSRRPRRAVFRSSAMPHHTRFAPFKRSRPPTSPPQFHLQMCDESPRVGRKVGRDVSAGKCRQARCGRRQ